MTPVAVVPLLLAALLCSPVAAARYSDRVDRVLSRVAIRIFGGYADGGRSDGRTALRAAHVPRTEREYGSTTLLYAAIAAIAGSILGSYVVWGLVTLLSIDPAAIRGVVPSSLEFLAALGDVPSPSAGELAILLCCTSLVLGTVAGAGTYWFRWWYPSYVADNRARLIEADLPSTVAFIYALSKSGMAFPDVVRIVARQEDTYGETAAEFSVAVRSMDTFGTDVITALQTMGRRSPSQQFREFTENLVSVLQSGQELSPFLERQYLDYREEAESQQEQSLGLLRTLAEGYVTVLVAGPLFLITILVVMGLAAGDTLWELQLLVYLLLPLANLGFIVYLSVVTDTIGPDAAVDSEPIAVEPPSADVASRDAPSPHPNVERVRYYRLLEGIRDRFGHPIRTLVERPSRTFVITVPIAIGVVAGRLPGALEDGFDAAAIDDTVAVVALFVLAAFAAAYELNRRRIAAIEAAVPDLLDRLASVNEAGMSMVSSIDRVRESDLGPLGAELDRVWTDVQWGTDLQTALRRFETRVGTRSVSRIVTLLTESMNASGNLATVLRIAARQAAADRRLERQRRQAMLEYMVVVYVSYLVFLFIIAVLAGFLLPNLPTEGTETAASTNVQGLGGFSETDPDAYATLFYHAVLVQGLFSGVIAGQLSTADVKAGAKHAAVMVGLSVALFAVVL
jgi:flagellar protein FlaJ